MKDSEKRVYAKNFETIREVVYAFLMVLYMCTVIMTKFVDNPKYFLIPLILYSALFLMLIEMFYHYLKIPYLKLWKNRLWFGIHFFAIILGAAFSYLIHFEILK